MKLMLRFCLLSVSVVFSFVVSGCVHFTSNDLALQGAAPLPFRPGEVVQMVAPGDAAVSYHVYFPAEYDAVVGAPLMIAFSPSGNGAGIVSKLQASAERAGWILVGCDQLRNKMKDEALELQMEDEVLDAILSTVPYDSEALYLAGFSGGAMRAYGLTARRPEQFAGVLALGGWLGGDDYQDVVYPAGLSGAIVNGDRDKGANKWDEKDAATLRKNGCRVRFFSFLGKHQVAPSPVVDEALLWFESERSRSGEVCSLRFGE